MKRRTFLTALLAVPLAALWATRAKWRRLARGYGMGDQLVAYHEGRRYVRIGNFRPKS